MEALKGSCFGLEASTAPCPSTTSVPISLPETCDGRALSGTVSPCQLQRLRRQAGPQDQISSPQPSLVHEQWEQHGGFSFDFGIPGTCWLGPLRTQKVCKKLWELIQPPVTLAGPVSHHSWGFLSPMGHYSLVLCGLGPGCVYTVAPVTRLGA